AYHVSLLTHTLSILLFFYTPLRRPISTLFPYTTLFRSLFHNALTRNAARQPSTPSFNSYGKFGPDSDSGNLYVGLECLLRLFMKIGKHTSELQSLAYLVCRLLLEKKKKNKITLKHYH